MCNLHSCFIVFLLLVLYCRLYSVVFFFKQKTAYGLRMSDWSSDVCSSDLGRARMTGRDVRKERCGRALGRRHERVFGGAAPGEEPRLGAIPGGMPEVSKGRDRIVEEHDAEARDDRVEACGFEGVEIGRASCMERGCRSV